MRTVDELFSKLKQDFNKLVVELKLHPSFGSESKEEPTVSLFARPGHDYSAAIYVSLANLFKLQTPIEIGMRARPAWLGGWGKEAIVDLPLRRLDGGVIIGKDSKSSKLIVAISPYIIDNYTYRLGIIFAELHKTIAQYGIHLPSVFSKLFEPVDTEQFKMRHEFVIANISDYQQKINLAKRLSELEDPEAAPNQTAALLEIKSIINQLRQHPRNCFDKRVKTAQAVASDFPIMGKLIDEFSKWQQDMIHLDVLNLRYEALVRKNLADSAATAPPQRLAVSIAVAHVTAARRGSSPPPSPQDSDNSDEEDKERAFFSVVDLSIVADANRDEIDWTSTQPPESSHAQTASFQTEQKALPEPHAISSAKAPASDVNSASQNKELVNQIFVSIACCLAALNSIYGMVKNDVIRSAATNEAERVAIGQTLNANASIHLTINKLFQEAHLSLASNKPVDLNALCISALGCLDQLRKQTEGLMIFYKANPADFLKRFDAIIAAYHHLTPLLKLLKLVEPSQREKEISAELEVYIRAKMEKPKEQIKDKTLKALSLRNQLQLLPYNICLSPETKKLILYAALPLPEQQLCIKNLLQAAQIKKAMISKNRFHLAIDKALAIAPRIFSVERVSHSMRR